MNVLEVFSVGFFQFSFFVLVLVFEGLIHERKVIFLINGFFGESMAEVF